MEALTSSCSKALVDGLGSLVPRGASAFHVSDRLEFCFFNDKVGNFRFLQMVQNKGITPVHASPSNPQVELETEELQVQQTEETKIVRIKFQLQKDCKFGEQFLIVGDDPTVGAWDPSNALPMTWSEGHVWFVEMDVPAGKTIQYKFILKAVSGNVIWQPGSDRFVKPWESVSRITVCEDWDNAGLQKIIEEEEEQPDHSNGKPRIDSEMSNVSENVDDPEEEMESDAANVPDFEDSITHPEEKPLAEPDLVQTIGNSTSSSMEKPMPIVAENIGSSEDAIKSTSRRRGMNNMSLQSEVTVHDLGHKGKASKVNKQGKKVVKANLFDLEESPVLVPGLTPSPTKETTKDKVEERVNIDTSVGALEAKDQNMPEFNEEQEESDDGKPQEITDTQCVEPELVDNEEYHREKFHLTTASVDTDNGKPQDITETRSVEPQPELVDHEEYHQEKFHLTTAIVKVPEAHTVHGNVLQNDIQWGRGLLNKFLSILGFL